MNLCIVTVYNSENCGSFLQAYALSEVLKSRHASVYFLERKTKGTSHDHVRAVKEVMILIARMKWGLAKERMLSHYAFEKMSKIFPVVSDNSSHIKKIDKVIIGSDTMWNFDDPYFWEQRELYSGNHFENVPVVTYAVSIANTKESTLLNDNCIRSGIKKLSAISVRDSNSERVVTEITGHIPTIVVDPTLLLDSILYDSIEEKIDYVNGRFVLLYLFEKPSENVEKSILEYSRANNLKIVSFGQYIEWADKNEGLNPARFLGYFHTAFRVITDTFHGTVFSIIYQKQFVSYGKKKEKIVSLLDSLSISNRLCDEKDSLSKKIETEINYVVVADELEQLRENSFRFIEQNILGRGKKYE